MKSPILSVIVPVYNVEKFLPGCLDSLADQNFKELEIILVNDGSTDKSLHILKEYASMYSAFKIITQKNAGLSAARNTGLKEAKGKYLAFLDSDDFVDPDMYLKLITLAEEYDADLVKCGILLFNNPDKSIKDVRQEAEDLLVIESQNEILKAYLNREINTVVWNGIYKTEILNNIAFPEGANFEDHYFTPLALKNTKKFVYTPEVFCYYRQRSGSITSAKNINSIADKVKSVNTLYDVVIQSNKPHLLAELFAKYFVRMATEYHNALIYNKPAKLRRKQNSLALSSLLVAMKSVNFTTLFQLSEKLNKA